MEIKNSDGVQSSFFYYLWSRSKVSKFMTLQLPDTFIYDDGNPSAWFFTGKKGRILKKSPTKTNCGKITEHFRNVESRAKTNIAASYMYSENEGFRPHQTREGQEINYLKDVLENKGYVVVYMDFGQVCRAGLR
jgi:hypothetical protein